MLRKIFIVVLVMVHVWTGVLQAQDAGEIIGQSGVKGGLIVHLGCGDGKLTVALRANDSYLVQGLDADASNVDRARETIRAAGCYGPVNATLWPDKSYLPYGDNVVNLLLVEEKAAEWAEEELLRVLVPNGVALFLDQKSEIKNRKLRKPWPEGMDDWTHYLRDPSNNAVSRDQGIEFLRQLQWIGGPRYARHHDHMSSTSAMVTTNGRLFYIFDHGSPFSPQLPSKWQVVARDAFNGSVLWRRDIDRWHSQLFRLKSGPQDLPRRLVAIGDKVYVTLSLNAPITALDAATGKTLRTYEGTKGTEEILCYEGEIYAVVNPQGPKPGGMAGPYTKAPEKRRIVVLKADSGEKIWEKDWRWVAPLTLTLGKEHALFFDGEKIVCLGRKDSKERWQSEVVGNNKPIFTCFAPVLVVADGIALFSGGDTARTPHLDQGEKIYALDVKTGKTLWTADHPPSGYFSAEDIFVIDGIVWFGDIMHGKGKSTQAGENGTIYGHDLKTGELKVTFKPDVETYWFHHRCHRAKATEKYLLTSRTGIEFVDLKKKHWTCHHWARGACVYGIMPANGMIYNPSHPCACYLESKLYGFNALAPHSASRQKIIDRQDKADRLKKGPAYGDDIKAGAASKSDWPMLRGNPARSGLVAAKVATALSPAWQTEIGGRLSSPVIAEGRLFVSAIDTHEIHALQADSGKPIWRFTTGARVDSPPTIWQGRVLFGSADGYVYCLRADDGRMCWRYRAAPADLRMGSFEQIESIWPVSGSVLVFDTPKGQPELWCVAGRSLFVDGGMRLLRLNPATGEKIAEIVMDDKVPGTKDNLQVALVYLNMPVALPDVLSTDGKSVYMRSQQLDMDGNRIALEVPTLKASYDQPGETAHLFCPTGFLDDIWWHRSYWMYGRVWNSGSGGYFRAGRVTPAGRPMVFDEKTVYSYGRRPEFYRWSTALEYMLYAADRQPKLVKEPPDKKRPRIGSTPPIHWKTEDIPVLVRGMVLANGTLFLAGAPDLLDERETLKTFESEETQKLLARQAAALTGSEGSVLWAVSAADGKKISELKLDALPVFDGLIAAGERLYMATTDGRVLCIGR